MAENLQVRRQSGFKSVLILTLATIILFKPQRVCSEDDQFELEPTTEVSNAGSSGTTSKLCPDYCSLTPDTATRGKAPFRMWYFDVSDGECKRFRWSGRGGNKNRFRKKADCEEVCAATCVTGHVLDQEGPQDEELTRDLACSLPVDDGRCTSESDAQPIPPQLTWYFDSDGANCVPFIYYGCGGNNNRHVSRKKCEETCN